VLVALAVLGVALAAASRGVSLATTSALDLKMKRLAGFVAENRMSEFHARGAWLGIGSLNGSEEQGGVEFRWRAEVASTPHPDLRRVEIKVADPALPDRDLRLLVGVLVREK
jgi:general secretion pathway protein I